MVRGVHATKEMMKSPRQTKINVIILQEYGELDNYVDLHFTLKRQFASNGDVDRIFFHFLKKCVIKDFLFFHQK